MEEIFQKKIEEMLLREYNKRYSFYYLIKKIYKKSLAFAHDTGQFWKVNFQVSIHR